MALLLYVVYMPVINRVSLKIESILGALKSDLECKLRYLRIESNSACIL